MALSSRASGGVASTGQKTVNKQSDGALKAVQCHQGYSELADLVHLIRQRDDGLVEMHTVVSLEKSVVSNTPLLC
jgi:hypothetical protein